MIKTIFFFEIQFFFGDRSFEKTVWIDRLSGQTYVFMIFNFGIQGLNSDSIIFSFNEKIVSFDDIVVFF